MARITVKRQIRLRTKKRSTARAARKAVKSTQLVRAGSATRTSRKKRKDAGVKRGKYRKRKHT